MNENKREIRKNSSKHKRAFIFINVLFLLAFILLNIFLITWYTGDDRILKYIKSYDYTPIVNQNIEITKVINENYVKINNKTGRPLKILQFSDTHLGCGFLSHCLDIKLVNEVFKCVSTINPDLIILSGDAISPIYVTTGTRNSYLQIETLITLFEKIGVPYTFCFGNHDGNGNASKEYIAKKLENAEHSFFLRGEKNVKGEGNYFVKIYDNDILASSMILMDSGGGSASVYEGVSKNQVAWYEKTINTLKSEKSDIKNLLFFHVPIPEYNSVYKKWYNGDENYVKILGKKAESISSGKQNGLYQKIKELDATKWLFCGHDHLNNFSILERNTGIIFSYGMSMDFSTYPLLKFKTEQRGGKIIEINSLGEVSIKLAPQDLGYIECIE